MAPANRRYLDCAVAPGRPQAHSRPMPAPTMRPLTAIGELHFGTLAHELLLEYRFAPVSPSTPTSLPLFANHTTASDFPSVVVAMAVVALPIGARQATAAANGLGVIFTAINFRPVQQPPRHPMALAADMP